MDWIEILMIGCLLVVSVLLVLLMGYKSGKYDKMTGGMLLFLIIALVMLIGENYYAFVRGEGSSGAIKKLDNSSVYEVLVTTTTPDGEVLVQINNLDIVTDDDKRRKIGVFPTFPPEGHILGTADKRTFLIPSGGSLTETTDGRIVLVWPNGTGTVIRTPRFNPPL